MSFPIFNWVGRSKRKTPLNSEQIVLFIILFQVHKEAIDKVPNSLPNRSNIEIEIYGMEGIPPEDMKEHEKQKSGIKTLLFGHQLNNFGLMYVLFLYY